MSSVFNTNNLSRNNINIGSIGSKFAARDIVNESYFCTTCDFLIESNREFNNDTKLLYKSILESNDDSYIINESFDDFFNKIKEKIDKIIEFIKNLVKRFVAALSKLVSGDKYINKHQKDFSKFKPEHEFRFNGYVYTFKPDIPNLNTLVKFNDEFIFGNPISASELKDKLDNLSKAANKSNSYDTVQKDVIDTINDYYNSLIQDLEGNYYDNLRAGIVNSNTQIADTEYANELYCLYRNGTSDTDNITANTTYIHNTLNRYLKYDDTINEIKKYQNNVENEYNRLKVQIKKMQETSYKTGERSITLHLNNMDPMTITYSGELNNSINTWLKAKVNQVQEISNIHSLAFSAKLDALTQSYQQDKTVLYHALNNISGIHKKSALEDADKIFDKNEMPEISISGSIVTIPDDIYETPIKDNDISEREPAKISKSVNLIRDIKFR